MIIRITDLDADLLLYLKQVMGQEWVRLEFLPEVPPANLRSKAELLEKLEHYRQWQQTGGSDFIPVDWDAIVAECDA